MSKQSFRELGVSRPSRAALAASLDPRSVPHPGARASRCACRTGRPRRARRPAPGRRSPSHCRSSSAPARCRPRCRRRSCSCRHASSRRRSPRSSRGSGSRKRPAVAAAYGGLPLRAQANRGQERADPRRDAGPARDLAERRLVDLDASASVILDEADRMLDMGFKPQVDRIVASAAATNRQTMFFSATLDGARRRARPHVHEQPVALRGRAAAEPRPGEIEHPFVPDEPTEARAARRPLAGERGLALVFVRTKRGADRLAERLEPPRRRRPPRCTAT